MGEKVFILLHNIDAHSVGTIAYKWMIFSANFKELISLIYQILPTLILNTSFNCSTFNHIGK